MTKTTDLERLKRARHIMAQLVLTDQVYAPIFERLEQEIATIEAERDLILRARAVVQLHKAMA